MISEQEIMSQLVRLLATLEPNKAGSIMALVMTLREHSHSFGYKQGLQRAELDKMLEKERKSLL